MSFITKYLEYANVKTSESPAIYHRWTAISILGANLGRNVWFPFGHSVIYPNQYIVLMGSPGARKGSAMNIGVKLLRASGYDTFAPDAVSKEMFVASMQRKYPEDLDLEDLVMDEASEIYAVAEELNDFLGQNDLMFCTRLTKLWDCPHIYDHPKLHGKSIHIEKPTVNMFGANTQQNLSLAIPTEAIGNGFCSRILFIHSDPSGRFLTFPEQPDEELKEDLVDMLQAMRKNFRGPVHVTSNAKNVLDRIYKSFQPIPDNRFSHYSTRRFTHLLKLCCIHAIANMSMDITEEIAINCNTVLWAAERRMPKALGEFGKAKNSGIAADIISFLIQNPGPKDMKEIWKVVSRDLTKFSELTEILGGMIRAEKIQVLKVGKKSGYVPCHVEQLEWDESLLNKSILVEEEL